MTRKRSRTRSRPARPSSAARPGSRTSSTIRAAASSVLARRKPSTPSRTTSGSPPPAAPTTGVRFQSASQGARSKPSPSDRSSTHAGQALERPHLQAADALVARQEQDVLGPSGVVGDLVRRAASPRRAGVGQRGHTSCRSGSSAWRDAEGVDGGVRVVPAIELRSTWSRTAAPGPPRAGAPRGRAGAARARCCAVRADRCRRRRRGARGAEAARERVVRERGRGGSARSGRPAPQRLVLGPRGVEVAAPDRRPIEPGGQPERGCVVQHHDVSRAFEERPT